jgi:membrane-bound lytic murein transglycosylase D
VDLRRVAEWAAVAVDDIQRLNPELRRWMTPIRPGMYDVRVPAGTAMQVIDGLAGATPGALNALQWHTVKNGETLASIARRLRVNRTDLAEANYLKPASRVRAGQQLVVPRMPSAALLARAGSNEPAAAPALAAPEEESAPTMHRVRSGDSLYRIARRYGTTVDLLRAWNNLKSSRLSIGTELVVHAPRPSNAQQ